MWGERGERVSVCGSQFFPLSSAHTHQTSTRLDRFYAARRRSSHQVGDRLLGPRARGLSRLEQVQGGVQGDWGRVMSGVGREVLGNELKHVWRRACFHPTTLFSPPKHNSLAPSTAAT